MPGAIWSPSGRSPTSSTCSSDAPVYVICQAAGAACGPCEFVEAHGIDAVNVAGGTGAWIASGRETSAETTRRDGRCWVDTTPNSTRVVDQLVAEPRYAIDTEFHRERTYFPGSRSSSSPGPADLVLVDPLAVDTAPLRPAVRQSGAGGRSTPPSRTSTCSPTPSARSRSDIFDTQVAAGFIGYGTPSLSSLVQGELGVDAGRRATGSPTGCAGR